MLLLGASEPVTEGEVPLESVAVGLPEMEGLELAAEEGLPLPVPLTVALWLGVCVPLPELLALLLGLAPVLSVPGAEGLWLELWLLLLVGDPEPVPLPVGLPVLLPVPDGLLLSLPLLLPELLEERLTEAELLGLAPFVKEAVLLPLMVELPLRVEEGVDCAVPVPELLPVAVPEGLGVRGAVTLADRDMEPDVLGEAPVESEAVALALTVLQALLELEGVAAAVLLLLCVWVAL